MLLIIPAIDIEHGHCARCIIGEPGTETLYTLISVNPSDLARLWRRENAKSIHITDHDALQEGHSRYNAETIKDLIRAVDIPVQLLSYYPTTDMCRRWLESGVYRVIISQLVLTNPEGVRELIKEYTASRIILGIRAYNRRVVFPDLRCDIGDVEFALTAKSLGIQRLVYTDISWEGTLCGPDYNILTDIARTSKMRVTAAGGVAGPEQLWKLQELQREGVDSVLVGRALYENRFPCQKIWRQIEAELEPELLEHTQ